MGLFHVFHGDHDHTCLDTAAEPVATRIGPATPPNVYGPLPSLNDWLKRVLKREISREQLDALVANGVRRPFHLATLSTSRFGACGFDGNEVRTVNAIAAAATALIVETSFPSKPQAPIRDVESAARWNGRLTPFATSASSCSLGISRLSTRLSQSFNEGSGP